MPANLTPQYHKAEEAFRRASSPEEELDALQLMLKEIPKHKGTDKLQAELKQKISKAKLEVEKASKGGSKRAGFKLPRQGAGRVVIIGAPNSGKSQLLKSMTRAEPAVAPYPFTTIEPMPGMMVFEDIQFQLVDTPPITADMFDPSVQALIRGADLVLLLFDLGSDDGATELMTVWEKLNSTKTRLGKETYLDEEDVGVSYTKAFLVSNKWDLADAEERYELFKEFVAIDLIEYRVSAQEGTGLTELKKTIFEAIDVVRVYTKLPTKKEADFEKPFTVRRGGTILDIAELVHKDLAANFKNARVWGTKVFEGTFVKADYIVEDKDIVEIHTA